MHDQVHLRLIGSFLCAHPVCKPRLPSAAYTIYGPCEHAILWDARGADRDVTRTRMWHSLGHVDCTRLDATTPAVPSKPSKLKLSSACLGARKPRPTPSVQTYGNLKRLHHYENVRDRCETATGGFESRLRK